MIFEKPYFAEREVVVFVDESGEPTLGNPTNPLFLFGACVTTGKDLDTLVRDPWRAVRENVRGNRDAPLHMREHGRRLRDHQIETICDFFRAGTFKRVSFCVTDQTAFENGPHLKPPVLSLSLHFLLRTAAEMMFGDEYVDGLVIVFEDGPFANKMRPLWSHQKLQRKDGAGILSSVPVTWAIADKSEGEPALEVADFIAHTAAGFTRPFSQAKFEPRFRSIFPIDRQDIGRSLTLNSASFVSRYPPTDP